MKTLTIQGVPYAVNDKNEVFLYQHSSSTEKHVQIGTYDPKTMKVNIFDKWQEAVEERLTLYRASLKKKTEEAMEKARKVQGISA